MKKTLVLTTILVLFTAGVLHAKNDLSDLRGLTLANAKIPIYNRGGKPQMMIFVNRAERRGRVISGTETVLDFIRPTASVDDIKDAWRLKPYKLGAPFKQIFDFWLPRLQYSDAVVRTSRADIDPETSKASGPAPIFLRSPLLDLNGVGFEADFNRREIRVNSDIKVVIRTGGSDPRDPKSLNARHQYLTATGDALLIELEAKRIMLIGSVVIREDQATISCDRLTVLMNKNGSGGEQKDKKFLLNAESEIAGISQLLADGNVVIAESGKNSGKMYADHLVYDIQMRKVTLTSDAYGKIMSRPELLAKAHSLNKRSPKQFPGYVVLDDSKLRTYGKSVHLNLRKSGDSPAVGTLLSANSAGSGKNDKAGAVKNIIYPDGIVICGKPSPGEKNTEKPFLLSADHGEFLPEKSIINLKKNVSAIDGTTCLTCDTATVKIKNAKSQKGGIASGAGADTVMCRGNVHLTHQDSTSKKAALRSDRADFKIDSDRIVFYDNVRAHHNQSNLKCDQLELFLSGGQRKTDAQSAGNTAGFAASGKSLERAVASGKVVMTDPNAVLNTGLMTLFFRKLAPGEKPADGMLQSGGVRLTRVDCDNGVRIVSSEKGDGSSLFGTAGSSKGKRTITAMRSTADLLANKSTLSGNVSVFDELSKLDCDTMHLYGLEKKTTAAGKPASAPAAADIDDDPFEIIDTEDFAPSRIAVAGNVELDKVECIKNVIITRKMENKQLRAGGARADYKVSTRKIILSGKAPERAWMQMDDSRQEADKLTYHLLEERFESSGSTVTTRIKQNR